MNMLIAERVRNSYLLMLDETNIPKTFKDDYVIFSSFLSRVFNENDVRGMLLSLSRRDIKGKKATIKINNFSYKTNSYTKKINCCILLSLRSSIEQIINELRASNQNHFYTRMKWFNILMFVERNFLDFVDSYRNPQNKRLVNDLKERYQQYIKEINNINT